MPKQRPRKYVASKLWQQGLDVGKNGWSSDFDRGDLPGAVVGVAAAAEPEGCVVFFFSLLHASDEPCGRADCHNEDSFSERIQRSGVTGLGRLDETFDAVLSMNCLVIATKTVICDAAAVHQIEQLDPLGMNFIPVPFRDAYPFGGALPCATADVFREGDCEDYFPTQVEDLTRV